MKDLLSTQLHFDGVTVLVIQLLFSSILQLPDKQLHNKQLHNKQLHN